MKSLVDKVLLLRRARKGACKVGDPCRMPCRVRKEVWLEPPAGARIRKTEKSKIRGWGLFVLKDHNKVEYHLFFVDSRLRSEYLLWSLCIFLLTPSFRTSFILVSDYVHITFILSQCLLLAKKIFECIMFSCFYK